MELDLGAFLRRRISAQERFSKPEKLVVVARN